MRGRRARARLLECWGQSRAGGGRERSGDGGGALEMASDVRLTTGAAIAGAPPTAESCSADALCNSATTSTLRESMAVGTR